MLTCIAPSKNLGAGDGSLSLPEELDSANMPKNIRIKSITSQLRDMGFKASGAYRNCKSCTGPASQSGPKNSNVQSDVEPDRLGWSFKRTGSLNSARTRRKEMKARLKGISSGEETPKSHGARRVEPVIFVEENEPKEWVAQAEPGVLITFLSLPRGGNDLKRIRFSRGMFSKWQAQKWWAENYDWVRELYDVQRLNKQAFLLPPTTKSENENLKLESAEGSPKTPPLRKERLPQNLNRPTGMATGYSSSDSFEQYSTQSRNYCDPGGITSTPKLSSISRVKTGSSSMDASMASSSSRELSISNASDLETEWVEEDEPGVYITIRALPGGRRELRRVRFSRERFGEVHARLWWDENRARINEQYL